jgi:uncharacterized membrane protein YphA (DoxX/SURF4 family)
MERLLGQYSPYLYAVLRIVAGFLFVCHGAQKLFGLFGGLGPTGGTAPLFSMALPPLSPAARWRQPILWGTIRKASGPS